MEKLLVIGVDTLAGSNLAAALGDRCDVVGLTRRQGFALDACRTVVASRDGTDEVCEIVACEQPQWVVHCGGASNSAWDWSDDFDPQREAAHVRALATAAHSANSRLTLLSSDAIFCGPQLFHTEQSPLDGAHAPAVRLRAIEEPALAADALVVRTSLFGWSPGQQTWAERLWAALDDEQPVVASGTRYATPLLASDAAEYLWQAYRRRLSGLWHLGGAERASMWQFAVELASACGKPLKLLRLAAASKHGDPALRVQSRVGEESSLDSRRLQRALGMPLPTLRESIAHFADQATNRRRDRLAAASPATLASSAA